MAGDLSEADTRSRDERFLASGDEAGTAPEDRRFRPDVEGLRAVAVILVVLTTFRCVLARRGPP